MRGIGAQAISDVSYHMQTLVNKLAAALVEAEKEAEGKGLATDSITVSCWHTGVHRIHKYLPPEFNI